jgi:hypothetical protein
MSHIVPIDGPVVAFEMTDPVSGEGTMTAGVLFGEAVRGRVKMFTYVDKVEQDVIDVKLVKASSLQCSPFSVTIAPGTLVAVACVVEYFEPDGTFEGQVGTEAPFIAKETPF